VAAGQRPDAVGGDRCPRLAGRGAVPAAGHPLPPRGAGAGDAEAVLAAAVRPRRVPGRGRGRARPAALAGQGGGAAVVIITLAIVVGVLYGAGTYLLVQRTLTRIVIGLALISHGT